MGNRRLSKVVFIIGAIFAVFYGGSLKREVIGALGGEYSLLTEFRSDISANLMHKFNSLRDFTLIAAFVCAAILWLLIWRGCKALPCAAGAASLYAAACAVYYFCFLDAPAAIALFAVKRALCSSLYITAPILLSDKPLP